MKSRAALRSIRAAVRCGGVATTRAVHATSRALAIGPNSPSVAVGQARAGRRNGLPNVCSAPSPARIAAPGTKGHRRSASSATVARSAG